MASFNNSAFVSTNNSENESSISDDQDDSRGVNRRGTGIYSSTSDCLTDTDILRLIKDMESMKTQLKRSETARKEDRKLIQNLESKLDEMNKDNASFEEQMKNMEDMIVEMKKENASDKEVMQDLKKQVDGLCAQNSHLKNKVEELEKKSLSDGEIIAKLRKIAEKNKKSKTDDKSPQPGEGYNSPQTSPRKRADWRKVAFWVIVGAATGAAGAGSIAAYLLECSTAKIIAAAAGGAAIGAAGGLHLDTDIFDS